MTSKEPTILGTETNTANNKNSEKNPCEYNAMMGSSKTEKAVTISCEASVNTNKMLMEYATFQLVLDDKTVDSSDQFYRETDNFLTLSNLTKNTFLLFKTFNPLQILNFVWSNKHFKSTCKTEIQLQRYILRLKFVAAPNLFQNWTDSVQRSQSRLSLLKQFICCWGKDWDKKSLQFSWCVLVVKEHFGALSILHTNRRPCGFLVKQNSYGNSPQISWPLLYQPDSDSTALDRSTWNILTASTGAAANDNTRQGKIKDYKELTQIFKIILIQWSIIFLKYLGTLAIAPWRINCMKFRISNRHHYIVACAFLFYKAKFHKFTQPDIHKPGSEIKRSWHPLLYNISGKNWIHQKSHINKQDRTDTLLSTSLMLRAYFRQLAAI